MKRSVEIFRTMRFPLYVGLLCLPLILTCCIKQHGVPEQENGEKKRVLNRTVLFIFGKQFPHHAQIISALHKIYNEESIKKSVRVLSYADMTAKSKEPRLKLIPEAVDTYNPDTVISLGIPEGSSKHFLTIKNEKPYIDIFTLLPDEETLPLEACSTFVADFHVSDLLLEEAVHRIPVETIQFLICSAVAAAELRPSMADEKPLDLFTAALHTVRVFLKHDTDSFSNLSFTAVPYVDPELNIPSYNYLILSDTAGGDMESSTAF